VLPSQSTRIHRYNTRCCHGPSRSRSATTPRASFRRVWPCLSWRQRIPLHMAIKEDKTPARFVEGVEGPTPVIRVASRTVVHPVAADQPPLGGQHRAHPHRETQPASGPARCSTPTPPTRPRTRNNSPAPSASAGPTGRPPAFASPRKNQPPGRAGVAQPPVPVPPVGQPTVVIIRGRAPRRWRSGAGWTGKRRSAPSPAPVFSAGRQQRRPTGR